MGLVGLIMPDPVTTIVGTKAIITGVAEIVGGLSSLFLGVGDVIEGVSN